jgi:hypothetical protein
MLDGEAMLLRRFQAASSTEHNVAEWGGPFGNVIVVTASQESSNHYPRSGLVQ